MLCVSVLALAVSCAPPPPAVDADWSRCVAKPTKACVFERARLNARANKDPLARAQALAQLAQSEIESRLRTEALREAQELYDLALTIDHAEQRHESLSAVVEVRAKAGEFAAALQTTRALKRDYWIEVGMRTIATEMTKARKTADGVALLRTTAETKNSVNTIRLFAWDVRDIVVERGEEGPVVALLQHAQELEDVKDNSFRFFTGVHHSSEFVPPLMIIAAALTHADKTEAALKIARQIKNGSSRATVLAAVAKIVANGGRTDDALMIARDVGDAGDRADVLRQMSFARGDMEGDELLGAPRWTEATAAARSFDAAMKIASNFATPAERDHAHALIAHTNASAADPANASRAAALIRDPGVQFPALLAIGEAQAKAGARADSIATFARAQEAALQDANPADPLSALAQKQAASGQPDQALAVVETMRGKKSASSAEYNGKPVDHNRAFALSAIAKALAREGRTAEALKLARQTEWDGGRVMNGVGVVAEGLAEAGRIDEALDAAKAQANIDWRDNLLLSIIKERVRARRFDHAKRLRRGIAGDVENARALLVIAKGMFIDADVHGEAPQNPGVTNADARAMVSEALKLTATMEYPNLALDILVEAGGVLRD